MIFAIDPGPEQSGWCLYEPTRGIVYGHGVKPNDLLVTEVRQSSAEDLAVEMIASYGMPVGKEVFDTCVWAGRFVQAWKAPHKAQLVYRKDIKLHLCGSARAKDGNVRQALIDLLGAPGLKKSPGPTYGVKSHAWSALAVAVYATECAK